MSKYEFEEKDENGIIHHTNIVINHYNTKSNNNPYNYCNILSEASKLGLFSMINLMIIDKMKESNEKERLEVEEKSESKINLFEENESLTRSTDIEEIKYEIVDENKYNLKKENNLTTVTVSKNTYEEIFKNNIILLLSDIIYNINDNEIVNIIVENIERKILFLKRNEINKLFDKYSKSGKKIIFTKKIFDKLKLKINFDSIKDSDFIFDNNTLYKISILSKITNKILLVKI